MGAPKMPRAQPRTAGTRLRTGQSEIEDPKVSWTVVPLSFPRMYLHTRGQDVPSVQFSRSVVSDSFQAHGCSTPGSPVHHQLPEFAQTHVHRVSDTIYHLILCSPLLLLPSIFPSIRVFSNELAFCIKWPKYWHLALASALSMNIQD